MQERPLDGKIAIVTGAASPMGLGRNMTEALVRAGARVSMMDINPDWLGQSSNDLRRDRGRRLRDDAGGGRDLPAGGRRRWRGPSRRWAGCTS